MMRFLGALCALAAVLESTWPCLAQTAAPSPAGGGLLVSPTYVLLDSHTRSKALLLSNRGVVPETYRITIVNRRQLSDGQLVETDKPAEGEDFAAPLVRYSPHEIVLPPNKAQTVRLLLQMPADLPNGEYRSHILFQQVPTEAATETLTAQNPAGVSVTIRAIFGVTIPLIVRKGNLTATASLSELHLLRLEGDQQALKVRVNRTGTRSLRGDLTILDGSDRIGRVVGVTVFLSTAYRELTIPLTAPGELKGHRLSATFAEDETIPGAASATQTLAP